MTPPTTACNKTEEQKPTSEAPPKVLEAGEADPEPTLDDEDEELCAAARRMYGKTDEASASAPAPTPTSEDEDETL